MNNQFPVYQRKMILTFVHINPHKYLNKNVILIKMIFGALESFIIAYYMEIFLIIVNIRMNLLLTKYLMGLYCICQRFNQYQRKVKISLINALQKKKKIGWIGIKL